MQNGVLPVVLPFDVISDLWRQLRVKPGSEITIDLPQQVVIDPEGKSHRFEINAVRKDRLVRGIDDIDVTLEYRDVIETFETRRRAAVPWLHGAARIASGHAIISEDGPDIERR